MDNSLSIVVISRQKHKRLDDIIAFLYIIEHGCRSLWWPCEIPLLLANYHAIEILITLSLWSLACHVNFFDA